jgi:hypothetical protein
MEDLGYTIEFSLSNHHIEKFWSHVDKTNTCWIWTGTLFSNNYGRFMAGRGKQHIAHRVAYFLSHGVLDKNAHVHHICENTLCVNHAHLELLLPGEHASLRRKSLCKNGHEMWGDNVGIDNRGARFCKECSRMRSRKTATRNSKNRTQPTNKEKTHCPKGHPYSEENTKVWNDGARRCITCMNDRKNNTNDSHT